MSRRHPSGYIRPGYNPLEVANPPTSPGASAGNESASVSFTAPSDEGGSAVTNYYAVSNPGGITSSSVTSPIAVSGLTNGTEYTFKVWGENSYGPSPYSDATGAVTPVPEGIEDVFSTYLWTGNGSTQTITNDIDLDGEGGLVWTKARSIIKDHVLIDSVRGNNEKLRTDTTGAEVAKAYSLTFASDGYSFNTTDSDINGSGTTYASWTFRKAPKFFDIVTYTGNDTAGRTISHNLGAVPGTIIIKRTNSTGNWVVYHRSLGATKAAFLNLTDAAVTSSAYWNNTAPTDSVFTIGDNGAVNEGGASAGTYVAYLFAHDAGGFGDSGEENVITCGSYTGNGSANGPTITLGWEPQWVMIKQSTPNSGTRWTITDDLRNFNLYSQKVLQPNSDAAEFNTLYITPTATGFKVVDTDSDVNTNGSTYIYVAIRRGPMKTPTDATKVFTPTAGTLNAPTFKPGYVLDAVIALYTPGDTLYPQTWDRLRGPAFLTTSATSAESNDGRTWDYMNGAGNFSADSQYVGECFKRAPGFFDVVCYTGTGSAGTVAHSLAVAPELMIVKCRNDASTRWEVGGTAVPATQVLILNQNSALTTSTSSWNSTHPTSSVFTVGTSPRTNEPGFTYVAYLFASAPGVSKVGSYTGTGALINIDCGFASSARFVIIKRTDSTGNWRTFDTTRGIGESTDASISLNDTNAQTTEFNFINPYSSGFTVNGVSPNLSEVNAVGGTYIYLAIA